MSFLEIGRDLSGAQVPAVCSFLGLVFLRMAAGRCLQPRSSYPWVIVWDRLFLNDQRVYVQT